jgi:hypothetical protein
LPLLFLFLLFSKGTFLKNEAILPSGPIVHPLCDELRTECKDESAVSKAQLSFLARYSHFPFYHCLSLLLLVSYWLARLHFAVIATGSSLTETLTAHAQLADGKSYHCRVRNLHQK